MAVIKYKNSQGQMTVLNIPISQLSILPEPSIKLKDKIFQYTGETTEDKTFVNGYFYKCNCEEKIIITNKTHYAYKDENGNIVYTPAIDRVVPGDIVYSGTVPNKNGIKEFDTPTSLYNATGKSGTTYNWYWSQIDGTTGTVNPINIVYTRDESSDLGDITKEVVGEWTRINVQPGGGEGGTSDYNELDNRPKINNILLSGNKSAEDLGLVGIEQGAENKDKILKVNEEGNLELAEDAGGVIDVQVVDDESEIKDDSIIIIDKSENYPSDGGAINLVAGNYEYSEKEKVIGKWIDGRPIYRKTININHDAGDFILFTDINIEIINGYGRINSSQSKYLTLPWFNTGEINHFYQDANGNFRIHLGWAVTNGYIIIDYIKTTDAEDSFKPEMISAVEIPVKHKYSTEEKIVGEWVDGKPIYEKTYYSDDCSFTSHTIIDSNIGSKNINIIKMDELYKNSNYNEWEGINNMSHTQRIYAILTSDNLRININDYTVVAYRIIIQYTKITN